MDAGPIIGTFGAVGTFCKIGKRGTFPFENAAFGQATGDGR